MDTLKARARRGLPIEEVAALRDRLRGNALVPGDRDYGTARRVWNGLIDRRPAMIVRTHGVADVIATLAFAREHDLPIVVRGGGHNVAGSSMADGAVVIDLSRMKAVHVDPNARTVWAQAGATWGDVDRESQAFGLAVAGGVVSTTGIAGLTLSGGLSWQRRAHGMAIDNLVAAEVVTADGRLLRASAAENTELFWALRGGGGNFGVVTAFEFRAHPLGPEVLFPQTMYPMADARDVFRRYLELAPGLPEDVNADFFAWTFPDVEELPEEARGAPFVGVGGLWTGDPAEGEPIVQPIRELGTPLVDMTGVRQYLEVQTQFDPFFPDGARHFWKSLYLDEMSDGAMEVLLRRIADRPTPQTLVVLRQLGGAIARVPADATAFGDRSAAYLLSIDTTWTDSVDDERCIAWTRSFYDEMLPFGTGKTYFNFAADVEADGDETVRASYGANYERLQRVKAAYDPDGVFTGTQRIAP